MKALSKAKQESNLAGIAGVLESGPASLLGQYCVQARQCSCLRICGAWSRQVNGRQADAFAFWCRFWFIEALTWNGWSKCCLLCAQWTCQMGAHEPYGWWRLRGTASCDSACVTFCCW